MNLAIFKKLQDSVEITPDAYDVADLFLAQAEVKQECDGIILCTEYNMFLDHLKQSRGLLALIPKGTKFEATPEMGEFVDLFGKDTSKWVAKIDAYLEVTGCFSFVHGMVECIADTEKEMKTLTSSDPIHQMARQHIQSLNSMLTVNNDDVVDMEGIGKKILIGTAIAVGVAIQAAGVYFSVKLRKWLKEQKEMEAQLVKMLTMNKNIDQEALNKVKSASLRDYDKFTTVIAEAKKLFDTFETSLKKLPNNIDLDGAFAAVRDCKILSADDKYTESPTIIVSHDYKSELAELPIGQRGWTPANMTKAVDDIRAHWKQINNVSTIWLKLKSDTDVVKIKKQVLRAYFNLISTSMDAIHSIVLRQSAALLKSLKAAGKLSKKN